MSEQRKPALTGGCQCGAVRYALFAIPERAGICHCRMCQKAVGGPFSAWANVATQDFAWTAARPESSAVPRPRSAISAPAAARRSASATSAVPARERIDRQPGHARGGDADEMEGIESRWASFDPEALAALPKHRTGEAGAPEDLTQIATYQHPDHDTPVDWRPAS